MLIRKAFKYRLKTRPADEILLRQSAGSCRLVWNKALALQKGRLDRGEACLSYSNLAGLLPGWKGEHPLPKEIHSQPFQQVLMNLDKAIEEAFNKANPKQFRFSRGSSNRFIPSAIRRASRLKESGSSCRRSAG
jgi:putative transposase